MGMFSKCLVGALPVTATAAMTGYCLKGYRHDHLLNRKKLCFSPKLGFRASLLKKKFLGGPSRDSVNILLQRLIADNSADFALQVPIYLWEVFIFEEAKDWYDFNEAGQLFISKDILVDLTREELTAFLSIQIAHTLAKHHTEMNSQSIAVCSSLSIMCGLYAFFAPRIHSFTVDMALATAVVQLAGIFVMRAKYRSLLFEADELALRLAQKHNVDKNHFITLFEKLVVARSRLPWAQRFITYCHYEERSKRIRQMLQTSAA